MANTDPLLRPILAYANAPTWEDAYTVLKADPGHLLSDNGTRLLHSVVLSAQFMAQDQPTLQAYAQRVAQREAFHARARERGLDEAWAEHLGLPAKGPPTRPRSSPTDGMSLTPAEAERAVTDRAFLASKLGLDPADPRLDALQAQLRQSLASQTDAPPNATHERLVIAWLNTPTYLDQRAMLNERSEILGERSERLLQALIAQHQGEEAEPFLQASLTWLQQARNHGLAEGWRAFCQAMHLPPDLAEGLPHPDEADVRKLIDVLNRWLNTPTYTAMRDDLADHPELLDPRTDTLLEAIITQYQGQDAERYLRASLHWLQTTRSAGGDAGWLAFQQAMDMHQEDGLSFPPEIQQMFAQLASLTRLRDMPQRIDILRNALKIAQNQQVDPFIQAALFGELANALQQTPQEEQRVNLEEAIAYYERALTVYTLTQYPEQYAQVQNNLGTTYQIRIAGERWANLEEAIACYQRALTVRTLALYPEQYAQTQNNLGNVYAERIAGEQRANREEAIACYERALTVYTLTPYPEKYAQTQNNLGNVYSERIEGERRANREEAIACYERALTVYTLAQYPEEYAQTQNNLGATYQIRIAGERGANREEAIACYERALTVYTLAQYPERYALTQNNLGNTYRNRIAGEQRANREEAIACYERALTVYTLAQYPEQYAQTQNNLGNTYRNRIAGEQRANREEAIACYERALTVYTLTQYPIRYRDTQLNLASAALDDEAQAAQARGDAAGTRAANLRAHTAFLAARQAQTELGWLTTNAHGRTLLQGEHRLREQYARDAWCCWQLGDVPGAIQALEAGRAQSLIESQALAGATFQGIAPELTKQFRTARTHLETARATGGDVRAARDALLAARQVIRASGHPEFLPGAPTWEEVVAAPAAGQVVLYLAATDFGGLALAVSAEAAPWGVALPDLTWQRIDAWLMRPDAQGTIVGGYQYAVRHQASGILVQWLRYQADAAEQERRFALPLGALPAAIAPEFATLRAAVAGMVAGWDAEARRVTAIQPEQARELRVRLNAPLADLLDSPIFARDLHWHFMRAELEALLTDMSTTFMQALRTALDVQRLSDPNQAVALVPCGRLGALPVHAAGARRDAQGNMIPFLETCELTFQAAARTLGTARAALKQMPPHGPVLAVGNPWPTWLNVTDEQGQERMRAVSELFWAAAEADGIDTVAENTKPRRAHTALLGNDATKARVLAYLAQYTRDNAGAWVQIAAHGSADPADPNRSAMLLAHGDLLTLADLQRAALLTGVRLFNASGCVTALGDLDTAPDELGSFAGGLLQSGAAGAIATLWSVSDQATFALMLCFAQYFLGTPGITPARAMRQAVSWLRTASRSEFEARKQVARARIKGITLTATGRDRDADRGAEMLDATARLSATHHAVEDALAELGTISLDQPDHLPPFAHPYFWAAFIVYGA